MTEKVLEKMQPKTMAEYIAHLVKTGKKVEEEDISAAVKYYVSQNDYDKAGELLERSHHFEEASKFYKKWSGRVKWAAVNFFKRRKDDQSALEILLKNGDFDDSREIAKLQQKMGLLEDAVETLVQDPNYRDTAFELAKKVGKEKAYEIGMRIYRDRWECDDRDEWAIKAARASGNWDFVLENYCSVSSYSHDQIARLLKRDYLEIRDIVAQLKLLKEAGREQEVTRISKLVIPLLKKANNKYLLITATDVADIAGLEEESSELHLRVSKLFEEDKEYKEAAEHAKKARDYENTFRIYEMMEDYSQALRFAKEIGDKDRIEIFGALARRK